MRRCELQTTFSDLQIDAHLHGLSAEITTGPDGTQQLQISGDEYQWSHLCQTLANDPPLRPKRVLLISTVSRKEAEQIAAERGLKHPGWDWQWIPQHPKYRWMALRRAYALSEDDLVGQWLDDERKFLLSAGARLMQRV